MLKEEKSFFSIQQSKIMKELKVSQTTVRSLFKMVSNRLQNESQMSQSYQSDVQRLVKCVSQMKKVEMETLSQKSRLLLEKEDSSYQSDKIKFPTKSSINPSIVESKRYSAMQDNTTHKSSKATRNQSPGTEKKKGYTTRNSRVSEAEKDLMSFDIGSSHHDSSMINLDERQSSKIPFGTHFSNDNLFDSQLQKSEQNTSRRKADFSMIEKETMEIEMRIQKLKKRGHNDRASSNYSTGDKENQNVQTNYSVSEYSNALNGLDKTSRFISHQRDQLTKKKH